MHNETWMDYNRAMDDAPDLEPDQADYMDTDIYADLREQHIEYYTEIHNSTNAVEEEEEDFYEHMARTRWIPEAHRKGITGHGKFQELSEDWSDHDKLEKLFNDWSEREIKEDICGYGGAFLAVSGETEEKKDDSLDPTHYNQLPEHLQHWNVVPVMGWDYYIGNATKYLWRAGKKSSGFMSDQEKEIEDLRKSIVYINKRIVHLGG